MSAGRSLLSLWSYSPHLVVRIRAHIYSYTGSQPDENGLVVDKRGGERPPQPSPNDATALTSDNVNLLDRDVRRRRSCPRRGANDHGSRFPAAWEPNGPDANFHRGRSRDINFAVSLRISRARVTFRNALTELPQNHRSSAVMEND